MDMAVASGRQARSRCEWLCGKGAAGLTAPALSTQPNLADMSHVGFGFGILRVWVKRAPPTTSAATIPTQAETTAETLTATPDF